MKIFIKYPSKILNLLLTLLYENENIQNIISNTSTFNIITPFEIVIKFILTIKLSEFNSNKKLFNLFQIFVRYNIIQGNFENINMMRKKLLVKI